MSSKKKKKKNDSFVTRIFNGSDLVMNLYCVTCIFDVSDLFKEPLLCNLHFSINANATFIHGTQFCVTCIFSLMQMPYPLILFFSFMHVLISIWIHRLANEKGNKFDLDSEKKSATKVFQASPNADVQKVGP
jgi:hypothetical protein